MARVIRSEHANDLVIPGGACSSLGIPRRRHHRYTDPAERGGSDQEGPHDCPARLERRIGGGDVGARVVATALEYLTVPGNVFGGRSPLGLDCSGLVGVSYSSVGLVLPRDANQQAIVGKLVATPWYLDGLRPGDALFFIDETVRAPTPASRWAERASFIAPRRRCRSAASTPARHPPSCIARRGTRPLPSPADPCPKGSTPMDEITRRDLLKGTVIAGAAALVTGCAGTAESIQIDKKGAAAKPVLTIAHITDVHVKPEGKAPAGMRACLRDIAALPQQPDVIFNGGDAIMDALATSKERAEKRVGSSGGRSSRRSASSPSSTASSNT